MEREKITVRVNNVGKSLACEFVLIGLGTSSFEKFVLDGPIWASVAVGLIAGGIGALSVENRVIKKAISDELERKLNSRE